MYLVLQRYNRSRVSNRAEKIEIWLYDLQIYHCLTEYTTKYNFSRNKEDILSIYVYTTKNSQFVIVLGIPISGDFGGDVKVKHELNVQRSSFFYMLIGNLWNKHGYNENMFFRFLSIHENLIKPPNYLIMLQSCWN